jgi:hypothetical protein
MIKDSLPVLREILMLIISLILKKPINSKIYIKKTK